MNDSMVFFWNLASTAGLKKPTEFADKADAGGSVAHNTSPQDVAVLGFVLCHCILHNKQCHVCV